MAMPCTGAAGTWPSPISVPVFGFAVLATLTLSAAAGRLSNAHTPENGSNGSNDLSSNGSNGMLRNEFPVTNQTIAMTEHDPPFDQYQLQHAYQYGPTTPLPFGRPVNHK